MPEKAPPLYDTDEVPPCITKSGLHAWVYDRLRGHGDAHCILCGVEIVDGEG